MGYNLCAATTSTYTLLNDIYRPQRPQNLLLRRGATSKTRISLSRNWPPDPGIPLTTSPLTPPSFWLRLGFNNMLLVLAK
mmetsp:Transcript_8874/g.12139  ORF Transcript_8874/g.12139 Transcript_8874/m.12139 type:complete len:80 (+) Transcript_8874:1-240(+)